MIHKNDPSDIGQAVCEIEYNLISHPKINIYDIIRSICMKRDVTQKLVSLRFKARHHGKTFMVYKIDELARISTENGDRLEPKYATKGNVPLGA